MEKHGFDFYLFHPSPPRPPQEPELPKSVLQQHRDAAGKRCAAAPLSGGLEGKAESPRARTELQIGLWTVTKHICPVWPHPRCESHPLALHFQPQTLWLGKVTAASWPAREVHGGVLAELFSSKLWFFGWFWGFFGWVWGFFLLCCGFFFFHCWFPKGHRAQL